MPAECAKVLKACLAQFVLLDVCGNPVTGAASKLTTKGFIQVVATAQIEAGTETVLRNACGEIEIDEIDDDEFKRYDLEMDFVQIDPEGLSLIANARALADAEANTKGFAVNRSIVSNHFSLELWTKVAGQACSVDGLPLWYYFAIPHIGGGVMTDFSFLDGPLTLKVTAKSKDASALWGRGPSCVLPATGPAIAEDHLVGYLTDIQPPDPVCGLQALSGAELLCA